MNVHARGKLSGQVRLWAIAAAAAGVVANSSAAAHSASTIVLVPPADLPELAQQSGEAMLLGDTKDGRTLLYIEQNRGTRLAIFDVTDPAHVKGDGSVTVSAPGPFDFVESMGNHVELVRFRQGRGEALLDLRKGKNPTLKNVDGARPQTTPSGTDPGAVSDSLSSPTPEQPTRDYQVVDTANSKGPARVVDVKQVRGETTNPDTGTTFLLTENGLYLIRRPSLETVQPIYLNTGG